MKQSQWIVAAVILAVVVFVFTFMMNFVGGPATVGGRSNPSTRGTARELNFLGSLTVPAPHQPGQPVTPLEVEKTLANYHDFWFRNETDTALPIGLRRKSCRCAGVEVFVLPAGRLPQETAAATTLAVAGQSPLAGVCAHVLALEGARKDVPGTDLMERSESVSVEAGREGWLRLRWKGERVGPQELTALLWMDTVEPRKEASLSVRAYFNDPLRSRATLPLGYLRDEVLAKGFTRYLYCWSSTRPAFRLEAKLLTLRGNPASNPFEVGTPVPLTAAELVALERENNKMEGVTPGDITFGRVLCGYKVPLTLRAVAADGKTPFEVGPFVRRVSLKSPDIDDEPRVVLVSGQVRGLVELGADDSSGDVRFPTFASRHGARETVQLRSEVPGLKLEVDRARLPEFLKATLTGPHKVGESRQGWSLKIEVLPGKVTGAFPRTGDPVLEDSAVYLRALAPNQPPRPIRIGVSGSATLG
jgi:hypothetical protein